MELKVISFNIRNNNDPDGHSVVERAPRLKKILDSLDADVMGFQESHTAWEPIIPRDYSDKYEILLVHRAENDPEAVVILWKKDRFDCIDKGWFWLSDTPDVQSKGWDEIYNCYRICLWVILKDRKSGKEFLYMNTHYGFGDKGQSDSSHLIAKRSKMIANLPTILTGDFNMTPSMAGYLAMTEHFTDVNAVTARDMSTTYHAYDPEKTNNQHIDYCFISEEVKPISYKAIKDTFEGKYPSDHYGILSNLEI